MKIRLNIALKQFNYLFCEVKLINNNRWWRWITCWFNSPFWVIANYRIERFLYLLFGSSWSVIRIVLLPINFLLKPWFSPAEIHYRADIRKGLMILHPNLGVVINGNTIIGESLLLTGGNCIGLRQKAGNGEFIIGNNVSLGANAVILGPVRIGNNVSIGAGAVVINDVPDNAIMVGVPAKNIASRDDNLSVVANRL